MIEVWQDWRRADVLCKAVRRKLGKGRRGVLQFGGMVIGSNWH